MLQFQDDIMKVKLMVIELREELIPKIAELEEKVKKLEEQLEINSKEKESN